MSYTPHIIEPVYKSIIRSVTDVIEEINDLDLVEGDVVYHNFEERSNEDNLPPTTIIGTDGFSFDENNGLWLIRYALAVSSYKDANLLREIKVIDYLQQRFGKGKKIKLLEMDAGDQVSELVVEEFRVPPMGQSEMRSYRTILLELARTGK